MFLVRLLLASIIMIVCFATFASGAYKLPGDEVEALRDIFKTLGKDWDFSNPCSSDVTTSTAGLSIYAAVNCSNCVGNKSDRVVGIILKGQNLSGTLPPNLVKLPCLQVLDLSLNYLSGSIPSAWGSVPNLVHMTVEFNKLSGNLPPELGNMSSIELLFLSSNYFTGQLPTSFAKLISLKDFRISDNQFSGQIPNYIQSWKNLKRLFIQASGLMGPIPSLDPLEKLTDLRISDLNGSEVIFPLENINVAQWEILILRNCNLTGQLPKPILPPGATTKLSTFRDLSFNGLSGQIPSNFARPLQYSVADIYLTGNLFTGPIPDWILNGGKNIDLSYNKFNFTIHEESESTSSSSCRHGQGINLFASSSMDKIEPSNIVSCLRSLPRSCPKHRRYKLHINCGGAKETVNKSIKFDADTNPGGPSNFFLAQDWSSSSTGQFMNDGRSIKAFILLNSSELSTNATDPKLYMTARVSPLSLTYYAFCLVNGNYTVKLYFSEIVFTDDETYSSLGRRIFDVYIQGKRVLKDFDIVKAAGGVRKPNIQSFNPVVVTNSTLEIRFYWAGKGTTDIPFKGDYGPLISAITMDSDNEPSSIPRGAVVGIIIVGVFVIILFVVAILWWKGFLGERSSATEHGSFKAINIVIIKQFSFSTINI